MQSKPEIHEKTNIKASFASITNTADKRNFINLLNFLELLFFSSSKMLYLFVRAASLFVMKYINKAMFKMAHLDLC